MAFVESEKFTATRLDERLPFGARVENLRADMLSDDAIRQALYDLWIREGLIVFRGLEGPETQIALSRVFGEPVQHPVQEAEARQGFKELTTIRYRPHDGWLLEVDGELRGQWLPWHSDLVYLDKINHGGILRPVQLPDSLGQTGFIDQIAAYDRLPADLKASLEGLYIKYKYDLDPANQRFGRLHDARVVRYSPIIQAIQNRLHEFPCVYHPLVYSQERTGRKVLNVSPWFAVGIAGMENDEGDLLLRKVTDHLCDERFAYFHNWQYGDMVLWDNWRLLHSTAGSPPDQVRWLERTTILGDYGLGRKASDARLSEADYVHV